MATPLLAADDLDLSVGPVALLGMILAVSQPDRDPAAFLALLPAVGGAGLAVGLLNALLTQCGRLPAAGAMLAAGTLLAAALSQANVHLAVAASERLTLDGAALALVLLAATVAAACARLGRRRMSHRPGDRPATLASAPSWPLRAPLPVTVALLSLAVAAVHSFRIFELGPSGHGATLLGTLALPLLGALAALVAAALLADAARPARSLPAFAVLASATPHMGLGFTGPGAGSFVVAPALAVPLLVVLASVVGPGAWPRALGRSPAPASGVARATALATSGLLAAVAGAMVGAQGVRDAGFLGQAAFVSLVPLVALVVGGQHALPGGWPRLVGAIAGAVLTAGLAVASTQPSDGLAPGVLPALLLAALAGPLWRRIVRRGANRAPLADA